MRSAITYLALITALGLAGFIVLTSLSVAWISYLPVPFWDQWEFVANYDAFKKGDWNLLDFFRQHNEHRIFLTRLIMYADLEYTHGSNLLNLTSIWVIQAIHAYLLWRLTVAACNFQQPVALSVLALILAAMFALVQEGNLFWGFQTQFVGVFAAATAAQMAAARIAGDSPRTSPVYLWTWLLIASVMGFVATFTLSNGLLVWPLMLIIAALTGAPRHTWAILGGTGILMLWAYLHGYSLPTRHGSPLESLMQPYRVVEYLAGYLGIPFKSLGADAARTAGFAAIGFLLAFAISQLARREVPHRSVLVLLGVVLFVAATAFITALGRMNFGADQAFSSRYATPALVFWVCVLALGWHWSKSLENRFSTIAGLLIASVVVILGILIGREQWDRFSERHQQTTWKIPAYTALLAGADDGDILKRVYPNPFIVRKRSRILWARGKYPYRGPVWETMGKDLLTTFDVAESQRCSGSLASLTPVATDGNAFHVGGWVWSPETPSVPHMVFIVDRTNRVCGVALSGFQDPAAPAEVPRRDAKRAGWRGHVANAQWPVRAYALLDGDASVCALENEKMPDSAPLLTGPREAWVTADLLETRIEGAWALDGFHAAAANAPRGPPLVYGSWVSGDADTGSLIMRLAPAPAPKAILMIPVITGPNTGGLRVALGNDPTQSGPRKVRIPLSRHQWRFLVLPLEDETPKEVELQFIDAGTRWGQWFAVGAPLWSIDPGN